MDHLVYHQGGVIVRVSATAWRESVQVRAWPRDDLREEKDPRMMEPEGVYWSETWPQDKPKKEMF
jgi:hypothetical protein